MQRWPQLRALLIVAAVSVNLFQGCPIPNVQRRHIERPLGQREVARWAEFLDSVGWNTTPAELTEDVLTASAEATRRHQALLAPFSPWFHYTQTRQRWALFPVADPDPWWMHLEGSTNGHEWELLYRPLDEEHTFLREPLEYRRVRAVWNPGTAGPRADQPRFIAWVAQRTFEERPDLCFVRVRYQRFRVQVPGDGEKPPEPSWHFEEVRRRDEVTR
ncbi:MAG: hypothetical protein AAGE52_21465 [Myxococcota bacterium]